MGNICSVPVALYSNRFIMYRKKILLLLLLLLLLSLLLLLLYILMNCPDVDGRLKKLNHLLHQHGRQPGVEPAITSHTSHHITVVESV